MALLTWAEWVTKKIEKFENRNLKIETLVNKKPHGIMPGGFFV